MYGQAIENLLTRGPRSAREIAAALDISQPTVSRALADNRHILAMRMGRSVLYGLVEGLMDRPPQVYPVFRISIDGELQEIGSIAAVRGAQFWYTNLEDPPRSRAFEDLPWFLQDLRPQGYLGRSTVWALRERGWPADLAHWSDRHALAALAEMGAYDHVGNLIIGHQAAAAFRQSRRDPLRAGAPNDEGARLHRYAAAAEAMKEDVGAGSSVHGEQPKFLAEVEGDNGEPMRSVIVKFSAPIAQENGQRWSDLLCMESIALATIASDLDIAAATARFLSDGHRAYLEVDRFDRLPNDGRRGVISLTSLDAAYVGHGTGWSRVVRELEVLGQVAAGTTAVINRLEVFGDLIGNTDRHLGNASVHFDGLRPMHLTPVYDFLPMQYAPKSTDTYSGPLEIHESGRQRYEAMDPQERAQMRDVAIRYWLACANDERISSRLREISRGNAQVVADFCRATA